MEDRTENIRRIAEVAKLFSDAGKDETQRTLTVLGVGVFRLVHITGIRAWSGSILRSRGTVDLTDWHIIG